MNYTTITPAMPPFEAMPKDTRNKDAQQLMGIIAKRFRSPEAGQRPNKTYKYLRAVAEAVLSKDHWKNPVRIEALGMSKAEREWVKAVIIWYHAATPTETTVAIYSPGYQAW